MFPAIRETWRQVRSGMGSEPIALGLKDISGLTFTPQNVDQYARNGYPELYRLLGSGGPSWSGESVTNESSLNLSVAWACRRIISESVAVMPLQMMQEKGDAKNPAKTHPLYTALHDEPNAEMSDMEFRETLTDQVVSGGNAFAFIVRRSGSRTAIGFNPLNPNAVRIDRDKQRQLVYIVKEGNETERSYTVEENKPQDILHIRGLGSNGVWGYSVIAMARQSMGAAMSAQRYAARYFAKGGRQPGYLTLQNRFKTKEEEDRFITDLDQAMDGADNYHKWPVFPLGVDFKPWGWSPEDSQFLETQNFNVSELCRWFLISPDLVGDMSKATLNNMEQLALRLVKMTLAPWTVRWDKSLRRCALTPEEKGQGYYFKHNINGLLRGDFQTRMMGYATALQNGHLSINEVRDLEDRNPVEGGDDHHIQLNMQSLPGETPTASQSAALVKVGKPKAA